MLLALTPESATAPAARPTVASERELQEAIRSGDERRAGQVYAALVPTVQRTLRRVLGAPYRDHQELVQRSLEQVIGALSQHPSPWVCRLETWATVAAARVAVDVLRARARRRDIEVFWGDGARQRPLNDCQSTTTGSAIDRLRWLLAELPHEQAEAIVICEVMGLTIEDAAVTSQHSPAHVRRRLSAAHERLARQMSIEA